MHQRQTIAISLAVLSMLLMSTGGYLAAAAYIGSHQSTPPVTSTSTTTGAPSATPFALTVTAADETGKSLSASVSIDGQSVSTTTPYAALLSAGNHTLICGPIPGYTSVGTTTNINAQANLSETITCTYKTTGLSNGLFAATSVDINGNPVNGQIILDGTTVGSTSVSVGIGNGQHTMTCGAVSGYATPQPVSFTVTNNSSVTLQCVYLTNSQNQSSSTLVVKVIACSTSAPCGVGTILTQQGVYLSNGQYGVTDNTGQVTFTVLSGQAYTATAHTLYGLATGSITIAAGQQSANLNIQVCCHYVYGLSAVGPLGLSTPDAMIFGVVLFFMGLMSGGVALALFSRKGP